MKDEIAVEKIRVAELPFRHFADCFAPYYCVRWKISSKPSILLSSRKVFIWKEFGS